MKLSFFILFSLAIVIIFNQKKDDSYIFFLHNRFLETHHLNDSHPTYGKVYYNDILEKFKNKGFSVISEQRQGNVNARDYAVKVVNQIDSLITTGVVPNKITVIGTSKGGYIAQYVSTLANNPNLNFVFIACYTDADICNIPEINFCGNILNIYEKTDPFGNSAIKRKEASTCDIKNYKDIQLNTGLQHGFLFLPLDAWIQPAIKWAKKQYN